MEKHGSPVAAGLQQQGAPAAPLCADLANAGLLKRRSRGNSVTSPRAGGDTADLAGACALRSRHVPALLCSQALTRRPSPCHAGSRGRTGPTRSSRRPSPSPHAKKGCSDGQG